MTRIRKRERAGKTYYVVRYGLHYSDEGRARYHERWFPTQKQARAFRASDGAQSASAVEQATIAHLAEEWMHRHVVTLTRRTQADYQSQLRRRILPHLGSMKVQRIEPAQISVWMQTISTDHPRSANKALGVLKAMMRWGRANGLTTSRAADDVRTVRGPAPKPANPLLPREVDEIANSMRSLRDRTVVLVAANTGLRFSELGALKWENIRLGEQALDVVAALDSDRSLKLPKSGSRRTVPVLAGGVDALREWEQHGSGTGLVFMTRQGRPLGRDWYDVARDAWGTTVSLHQMRDTYASVLIAAGCGPEEVTMALGHSSIELTRQRYAQLLAPRMASIADRANQLVERMRDSQ